MTIQKLKETQQHLVLPLEDGRVDTVINDEYSKLKYGQYEGNRIFYWKLNEDGVEIAETFDDRIFNCSCINKDGKSETIQIRDEYSNKLCDIIQKKSKQLYIELYKEIYFAKHKTDLLNELMIESYNGRVVAQKDGNIENPKSDDLYQIATLATVMKTFDMPDDSKSVIVQGLERIEVKNFTQDQPYFMGLASRLKEHNFEDIDTDLVTANINAIFKKLVEIAPYLSDDQANTLINIKNPSKLIVYSVDKDLNFKNESSPIILSAAISSDNSTLTVTMSEAVVNAASNGSALEASDFSLSISGGTMTLSSSTPSSISTSSVYDLIIRGLKHTITS